MTLRNPPREAPALPIGAPNLPRIPTHLSGCPVVAVVPCLEEGHVIAVCDTRGRAGHPYAVWHAYQRNGAWQAESGDYMDNGARALDLMLSRAGLRNLGAFPRPLE